MQQLIPNAKAQFIDSGGQPLANGTVGFYFPGTLNPKATYQDAAGTIANTNPVQLDSRGQALIWGSGVYRQILKDASGVTIWDQITEDPNAGLTGDMTDDVFVAGDGTGNTFIPGTTTQLTLSVAPGAISNTWIFFDAAYQADDQVESIDDKTLTFVNPIPVGVQEVTIKSGTTVAVGIPPSGSVTDASVATNANINSSKLSFLQSGAGAIRRTVQSKLRDVFNVMDFGAKGDGTTDDTVAIQNAINAAGNGILWFPPLTFLFSSLTMTGGTTLQGSGKDSTTLMCNQATGDSITCTGTNAVQFLDMQFASSITRAAGYTINISGQSGDHLIRRCLFNKPFNAINFLNSVIWAVEDSEFVLHTGTAISVANVATPDAGDSTINGCVFNASSTTAIHIHQFSSGGLRVVNNKFLGANFHYLGEFNSGASQTSILLIEGNSSEHAASANFAINSSANTQFGAVNILGNQLTVDTGATSTGILIADPGYAWISFVNIADNILAMGGLPGQLGMIINRGTRLQIGTNLILGNNVEGGVQIGAGVTSGNIAPQTMYNLGNYWGGAGLANVTYSPGRLERGLASCSIDTTTPISNMFRNATPGTVTFAQPYAIPPDVKVVALSSNNAFAASIVAGSITTTGFQFNMNGWTDTVTGTVEWSAQG